MWATYWNRSIFLDHTYTLILLSSPLSLQVGRLREKKPQHYLLYLTRSAGCQCGVNCNRIVTLQKRLLTWQKNHPSCDSMVLSVYIHQYTRSFLLNMPKKILKEVCVIQIFKHYWKIFGFAVRYIVLHCSNWRMENAVSNSSIKKQKIVNRSCFAKKYLSYWLKTLV